MRYFTVLVIALTLAACGTTGSDKSASKAKAPLDNKTFAAQMIREGASEPAELVFKNGMFRSTAAERHGFAQTSYTAVKEGDFTMFEVVATSPDNGKMTWKGQVRGDTIHGTAVWDRAWYRPDAEYTFTGKLK